MRRSRLVVLALAAAFLVTGAAAAATATAPARLPGEMTGKGPWGANDGKALKSRLKAIGLDALPREALKMHIHQRMAMVVNGKFVYLPPGIGIDRNDKFITELHTHDSSGIIHVESPLTRKFTLGEFFDVWGLRFTKDCLGGYCNDGARKVRVWTNGKPVKGDPRKIVLTPHLSIVVAYGTLQSVPKPIPPHFPFPAGY
jgi:hypothetical protein